MDMMEVPSHFYQMYASDPMTLQMFARHCHSGESVPPALIDTLLVGLRTGSALSLQEQVGVLLSFNPCHAPRPLRLQAFIMTWFLKLPGEQGYTSVSWCLQLIDCSLDLCLHGENLPGSDAALQQLMDSLHAEHSTVPGFQGSRKHLR